MLAKKDNLMLKNQFKALSINLNAQHVNGMTHFVVRMKLVLATDRKSGQMILFLAKEIPNCLNDL